MIAAIVAAKHRAPAMPRSRPLTQSATTPEVAQRVAAGPMTDGVGRRSLEGLQIAHRLLCAPGTVEPKGP